MTEKMDGENTTIYNNTYHARSLDSAHKEYHSYLLNVILPQLQYKLKTGSRVCGEYLYAKHSIKYDNLKSYFLVFSIWDEDICMSWDDTKEYAKLLESEMVPELYDGVYDEKKIKQLAEETAARGGEGIVVRAADAFAYTDFENNMAKYVRKNHVQTSTHWSTNTITKNNIIKS